MRTTSTGPPTAGRRPLALNINLDSFSECLKLVGHGRVQGLRDPCFFGVMDRFLRVAAEYGARLTIFVIGRDLEQPENRDAVARWHELGHEIGNHSYSHRQDLNLLSPDLVAEEVERAHVLIHRSIGALPRGFVAPGWASGHEVTRNLRRLGYRYDSSLAPTWLLSLAQVRLRLKSRGARDMIPWLRPDWRGNLFGNRSPYTPSERDYLKSAPRPHDGDLVMLPLPVTPLLRIGIWHTLGFLSPPRLYLRLLSGALSASRGFYYLLHPVDLVDPEADLSSFPASLREVERLSVPLGRKEWLLRKALDMLAHSGRFVTMSELADLVQPACART